MGNTLKQLPLNILTLTISDPESYLAHVGLHIWALSWKVNVNTEFILCMRSLQALVTSRHQFTSAQVNEYRKRWKNSLSEEVVKLARSRLWVPKPGSLLANNYHLLKRIHIWGLINIFDSVQRFWEEKKNLSFKSSQGGYLSNYISVSADASSLTVVKSHLDLTSDLGASRRWGLWTFQLAHSFYVKSCSRNIYTCLPRPQILLARQAGLPTRNQYEEMDFEPTLL